MYNRQKSSRRNRPYSIKKTSIKDENIDRQIIVIHRAIAHKLLKQPELAEQVKARLEAQREEGKLGYSHYITWVSALELIDQSEVFINALTEDSPKMRKLRRRTPFTGILTEAERVAALEQDAIGVIATQDLSGLF
ncbi:hypothetical protein EXU30_13275 [Shewanella maritima]|uniref:Uncharacterized protein n=1 Tax=Shewanella maritima TaxID=2520507 RepID=A0A411PJ41_9GAMM|nr:hypothetical protein [Shewanella maritima]QBF83555.1 hypothetical protein EXU30_13275 [Shewanella maritima]